MAITTAITLLFSDLEIARSQADANVIKTINKWFSIEDLEPPARLSGNVDIKSELFAEPGLVIFSGGYRNLSEAIPTRLVEFLLSIEWTEPAAVALIIQQENDAPQIVRPTYNGNAAGDVNDWREATVALLMSSFELREGCHLNGGPTYALHILNDILEQDGEPQLLTTPNFSCAPSNCVEPFGGSGLSFLEFATQKFKSMGGYGVGKMVHAFDRFPWRYPETALLAILDGRQRLQILRPMCCESGPAAGCQG
ncbi:hypothetical protein Rleg4DRAFT_2290 [Rhizobium leguminosarum bv. trifolii WSM2297]|uniref:Uncharacterized protein n=1 Tax=Rhizobium leguminosarum bv. trifolii WSM2297 TaxID=754762 RepID=J0CM58_RHILT|nr:hypothetical protein [Rhizobium leguminosarum]EJC80655.1 hypothetical protein Rleg4DRAFT_2290 [Rhizobium leguminosarum bv. trifolii WSM2297]